MNKNLTQTMDRNARPAVSTTAQPAARNPATDRDNPFDLPQLVRRCMGRIELAERLLASFESRFPEDLSKIEDGLAADDPEATSRLVHQMKGAAANVSATSLYDILSRLEQAVRHQQRETASHCLGEVQEAWNRYQQFKSSEGQR
jgi:HPt (histidine-containing phosphotransfer) domain-containing protein